MDDSWLIWAVEAASRAVRLYGPGAFYLAVALTGLLAGVLTASGITGSLWAYIALAFGLYAGIVVIRAAMEHSPHRRLFEPVYHSRIKQTSSTHFTFRNLKGESRPAIAAAAISQTVDEFYTRKFTDLVDADADPIFVIPSSPRDLAVGDPMHRMLFGGRGPDTSVHFDPGPFGVRVDKVALIREYPTGMDLSHAVAIRDIIYIPDVAASLPIKACPSVWPEHCVDPAFLASHDLVVVGGPDTNFWHAVLYECVVRKFENERSSVPLAVSLSERGATGVPRYGSQTLFVNMLRLSDYVQSPKDQVALDERDTPTYFTLLVTTNPFCDAIRHPRWCVFAAGTRSLGTAGSLLALACMAREMVENETASFFSVVPTDVDGVTAKVAAVLGRVRAIERAASLDESGQRIVVQRTRREIPLVRDTEYHDSYIPRAVEILQYEDDGSASWRRFTSDDVRRPLAVL